MVRQYILFISNISNISSLVTCPIFHNVRNNINIEMMINLINFIH